MIFRFFCPIPLAAGDCVTLPEAAAHHATRVLRLAPGASVILFDGEGAACAGTLTALKPHVTVQLAEALAPEPEPACRITLVQALASGDKMDWVVQKAVELGVHAIVPVAAKRSVLKLEGERAVKRLAHWRSVAVSACEQSGRNRVPEVAPVQALSRWLARADGGWVLAPGAAQALRTQPAPAGALTLLVGPEGGWEDEELAAMTARGIQPIRLGPRVLRTETAGLAALAAIQALWGDF
ncbi:16S rRNA (uracil(1498)-N(3))-methyltransferase [Nitrogeniibacter mangrovi]|uniref:Ribosomal RNA small subunit methyltransferase E n=1 Tax=Nitrogeniibacter mangrovi TaxID=2016596 RepID=A0A6C1B0S8_9RHOO|nr:16S rRNA (uracil(1498)-N(3))-methyltransferase [Nitrogeniibacter mangrovi]QID17177.1 16S rRNA (uracil(1498)-N(3))-methyltransferase [Nitrogeniibacter mangrovi]